MLNMFLVVHCCVAADAFTLSSSSRSRAARPRCPLGTAHMTASQAPGHLLFQNTSARADSHNGASVMQRVAPLAPYLAGSPPA